MLASVDPPEAVVIDVGLAELFPVSEADSFRSADPAGTLATMAPVPWRGGEGMSASGNSTIGGIDGYRGYGLTPNGLMPGNCLGSQVFCLEAAGPSWSCMFWVEILEFRDFI